MSEERPERGSERRRREIETDEILERLEPESRTGTLIRLVGRFLGNSDREGYYRLYLTEQLNRYVEFPKDATLDAERFPSGRIVVWLRNGTKVVETASRDVAADFLTGAIQRGAAAFPGRRIMADMTDGGGCCGGTQLANCNSTVDQYTCSYSNCPVSTVNCPQE
jgi:hypothetical protein